MADEQGLPQAPTTPEPQGTAPPQAPVVPNPPEATPPPPPKQPLGSSLKNIIGDAMKEGGDYVANKLDEAQAAVEGATPKSFAEGTLKTVGAVGAKVANTVTNTLTSVTHAINPDASATNALHIDEESTFGKPANWMDSVARTGAAFVAENALVPEAKGMELLPKLEKFATGSLRIGALFTAGEDEKTHADLVQHMREAPNAPTQRFMGMAIQAHTPPEALDQARRLGMNTLTGAAMEATLTAGLAVRAAASKWSPEFFQGVLDNVKDWPKDVAQIIKGKTVGPTEAVLAANAKRATERQAAGQMLESNLGPIDQRQKMEASRAAGNSAYQPPPEDMAEREAAAKGPEEKVSADSLMVPHPHEQGSVTLPDAGQAQVEVAQRNMAALNQKYLEKGPAAFKDGWSEAAAMHRAGGPLSVIDNAIAHHGIHIPVGTTRQGVHDYIDKLAGIVEGAGGKDVPHILTTARKAVYEWSDETHFSDVMKNFQSVFNQRNVGSHIVATHMYARALSAQAAHTMQALDLAPDSPAAQSMAQKTWESLSHMSDLMRGTVPEAEHASTLSALDEPAIPTEGEIPKEDLAEPTKPGQTATPQAEAPAEGQKAGAPIAPLPPKVLTDFAQDVRIADGNPVETADAVKTARLASGVEALPAEDHVAPPTAEGAPPKLSKFDHMSKMILYYRVNNMISGVGTIAKIGMSQSFMLAKQPAAAMLGSAGLLFKGDTQGAKMLFQEGYHLPMGYFTESGEALKGAARAFKAGRSIVDPKYSLFKDGTISPGLADQGRLNWLTTAIGAPGRLHTSITEFSKILNFRSMERSNAIIEAGNKGGSPQDIAQAVQERLKAAFDPATGQAVDMADGALEIARRNTLTQPLDGTLFGDWVNKGLNRYPVIHAMASPFMTISTNDFAEKWAMFPALAAAKQSVKDDLASGDAMRWGRAIGNQGVGAALIGAGLSAAYLRNQNFGLTGSPPANAGLRKQQESMGAEWNRLNIGRVSINLDRIPIGGPMIEWAGSAHDIFAAHNERQAARDEAWQASGGNKYCYMGNNPVFEWLRHTADVATCMRGSSLADGLAPLQALGLSTAKKALDTSWLQSATQLSELLTGGTSDENERNAVKWAQDQMQTMVYGNAFWKSINSDNIHRESRTVINHGLQNVPFYSRTLEPEFNMFGKPEIGQPGFVEWLPDHTQNSGRGVEGPEGVRAELLAMGATIPGVPKHTPGANGQESIDWTDRKWDNSTGDNHQSPYARMNELMASPIFNGKTSEEFIREVMSSDDYKSRPKQDSMQPDGPRFHIISQYMEKMHDQAKQIMMAEPRYERFAEALGVTKATNKDNKYLSRQAIDSATSSLLAGKAHILDSAGTNEQLENMMKMNATHHRAK